jgi:hypothetical protein
MKHTTTLVRVDSRFAAYLKHRAKEKDMPVTTLTRRMVRTILARRRPPLPTPGVIA